MSFAPKTLFGRNLLLIVLLIALAQLASGMLLRALVMRPRLDHAADSLARNIAAVRDGVAALPSTQRAAFVDAFNRRGRSEIAGAPPDPLPRSALTPMERRFVRTISAHLAAEGATAVWRREDGGSLGVRLVVDDVAYRLVLPGVLPAREFSGTWIAATLASVALALLGAFAIQRRLNRPLSRVVAAAGALARGAMPQPLAEDGPYETATLARSFNQLVASLAQADRERALMLAGVSHDLRTPLAKLRLGVEILADRSEPELSASMNRSIAEMDAIVGQFLDFARVDEAEVPVVCDLNAMARAVAVACADHGQPIELAPGSVAPLRLPERAVRRCVDNLVENALRHGQPPVTIATGSDARNVWIEVCDHGAGIAAADAETLKQPFQRAQGARGGVPGAGLGLAIVERLVRAQGGRLELLTHAPSGLRARISLPLAM